MTWTDLGDGIFYNEQIQDNGYVLHVYHKQVDGQLIYIACERSVEETAKGDKGPSLEEIKTKFNEYGARKISATT